MLLTNIVNRLAHDNNDLDAESANGLVHNPSSRQVSLLVGRSASSVGPEETSNGDRVGNIRAEDGFHTLCASQLTWK